MVNTLDGPDCRPVLFPFVTTVVASPHLSLGVLEWRKKTASDKGLGRHCEVAIKAHNLANPQWTPKKKDAPAWMKLGFELFQSLEKLGPTYEAFPSASYTMLMDNRTAQLTINFSNVWKHYSIPAAFFAIFSCI